MTAILNPKNYTIGTVKTRSIAPASIISTMYRPQNLFESKKFVNLSLGLTINIMITTTKFTA